VAPTPAWRPAAILAAKKGSSPWSTPPGGKDSGSGKAGGKADKAGGKGGKGKASKGSPGRPEGASPASAPTKPPPPPPATARAPQAPPPPHKGPAPAAAGSREEAVKLSASLQVQTMDELTPYEPMPSPLWPTFCGHLEGEWLGQYGAYTPWAGEGGGAQSVGPG